MATAHHAVVSTVVAAAHVVLEVELARKAATILIPHLPEKSNEQIVDEVLVRLGAEKQAREQKGLNHWTEYAPEALDAILSQIQCEASARREQLAGFYRKNHSQALAFACAALKARHEAEDIVAETYVELLQGRTTEKHFFRALKFNILNRQCRRSRAQEMFEPTEKVFDPRHVPGEDIMGGGEGGEFSLEPASARLEDRDPLDILIARDEENGRQKLVAEAMKDPRWRFCKRKKWAQPLLDHVPN